MDIFARKEKTNIFIWVRQENNRLVFQKNCGGKKPDFASSYRIIGNGWNCRITKEGNIVCETKKDGQEFVYIIDKTGFSKLILNHGGKRKILRKVRVITEKGEEIKGCIRLTSGENFDDITANYRSSKFIKFLNKYGLSKVYNEEPNKNYLVVKWKKENDEQYSFDIETDGKMKIVPKMVRKKFRHENFSEYSQHIVKVTDATWVRTTEIITSQNGKIEKKVTLYTIERDLTNLKGLPLEVKKQ